MPPRPSRPAPDRRPHRALRHGRRKRRRRCGSLWIASTGDLRRSPMFRACFRWRAVPAIVLPLLILGLVVTRGGPSAPAAAAAAGDQIAIGAVLPLSGKFSASGKYFQQGYELAAQEVNDAGGLEVAGKKMRIALTILDDGSDGTKSRSLVEQLVTRDKVN